MIKVKILGIEIGTAQRKGDNAADNCVFYGFIPNASCNLPYMADMTVDFINGTVEHWQDTTKVLGTYTIVSILPRLQP